MVCPGMSGTDTFILLNMIPVMAKVDSKDIVLIFFTLMYLLNSYLRLITNARGLDCSGVAQ